MEGLRGIEYLRKKLTIKKPRVITRYQYYEMKMAVKDLNITMPAELSYLKEVIGWCGKAADAIADRVVFREFEDDHFNMNNIYNMNNPDILFDSAILSAVIASCCFIYITNDETGFPRMQVIDGANATGVMDEITGMLREGYAVLDKDDYDKPLLEAYFVPGRTDYYEKERYAYSFYYKTPYPLLVPVIHRPDAKRPFGHSRISRACMGIQQAAMRTIKRAEVSAEFYSFPQKYVTGLAQDAEQMEKWKATMSTFLQFSVDDEGNSPTLGQFAQQSMAPFTEQIRMFAGLFAGETGLTIDDLGFPSDNPSSSEAIKASHESLRLTARKAQRTFGSGFLNAGYLAACIRDDFPYQRSQIYLTKPKFEPIFEPDASQLSGIGDAVAKIQQAFPNYFTEDKLRDMTGI